MANDEIIFIPLIQGKHNTIALELRQERQSSFSNALDRFGEEWRFRKESPDRLENKFTLGDQWNLNSASPPINPLESEGVFSKSKQGRCSPNLLFEVWRCEIFHE